MRRLETGVDSLPQAQESCFEAIHCAVGVPLNQMSEGKFNLHLTMHSLIVANIVKRKINSSVQYSVAVSNVRYTNITTYR